MFVQIHSLISLKQSWKNNLIFIYETIMILIFTVLAKLLYLYTLSVPYFGQFQLSDMTTLTTKFWIKNQQKIMVQNFGLNENFHLNFLLVFIRKWKCLIIGSVRNRVQSLYMKCNFCRIVTQFNVPKLKILFWSV